MFFTNPEDMATCEEQGEQMPLQSMPSSSLQRLQTSSVGQRNSRRVLFGALLGGVLLVTIAAVCVVAAVITTGPSSDQKLSPVPDQGEMRPRQVFRGRRLKRHTRQSPSVPTRAIPTRATPTSAPSKMSFTIDL